MIEHKLPQAPRSQTSHDDTYVGAAIRLSPYQYGATISDICRALTPRDEGSASFMMTAIDVTNSIILAMYRHGAKWAGIALTAEAIAENLLPSPLEASWHIAQHPAGWLLVTLTYEAAGHHYTFAVAADGRTTLLAYDLEGRHAWHTETLA